MPTLTPPRRLALLVAATLPLAVASVASAQYRIDNGAARDASNRLGSGGFNDAGGRSIGGLAGNYIVTGNVTNGRSFRGALGYTDPSAFRGSLGSASFDNYIRDSTGMGQIRGNYGGYGAPGNALIQPYFGAGQTVAPPAGFVRDNANAGAFVPRTDARVVANDARIDFGGASRQQVQQSVVSGQRTIGGAGLATTSGQQWANGAAAPLGSGGPLNLSEYTRLARPTASGTSVFGGALSAGGVDVGATSPTGLAPVEPTGTDLRDARLDQSSPNAQRIGQETLGGPARPAGVDGADAGAERTSNPNLTGQSSSIRSTRVADNNAQYAELRNRLAERLRVKKLPGQEAVDQARQTNAAAAERNRAAGTTAAGSTPTDASQPIASGPRPGAADERIESRLAPGAGAALTAPPTTPGGDVTAAPGGGQPAAVETPPPQDTLNLPRPEGDPVAAADAAPATARPLEITSFAVGIKDSELAKTLTRAEELMKAGKFSSALDAYDRAEELATDDPLVFVARGIAELGGSYYRKAELHLRQAFTGDESLLQAKFDLRGLLTDERLNFILNDLNEVARTNPNDPGPLVLLGFIYYHGGMEGRAGRALELAQERAGGKDAVVKLLQENWTLTSDGNK